MFMLFILILLGVFSLLYLFSMLRLKRRIVKTCIEKYQEYLEKKSVVFCYVDDEFAFRSDVNRYIKLDDGYFLMRGKEYGVHEIKNISYHLNTFNFKLRDYVYVKIDFEVLSDVYKVDSMFIRPDYVISFVLIVYMIKKNITVVNKEQVKKLLKELDDKNIKIRDTNKIWRL